MTRPASPGALLTGWGRTAASYATVHQTADADALAAAVAAAGPRGIIARGLGRSYNDAAQNGGGDVAEVIEPSGALTVSPTTGTVCVPAGASIDQLLCELVPKGWFVPVTPGTRQVTVGGAIASDIHGKNHHRDGSFGPHVRAMTLLTADGTRRELRPSDPLFWDTVAGMGLTGIVLDAVIDLVPIESSRMAVDTWRLPDLDAAMAQMAATDGDHRYSVAWIDLLASGRHLGRAVLTNGDHAPLSALGSDPHDPLAFSSTSLASAPPFIPGGLLNRASIRAFNELWFRKAPRQHLGELQSIGAFFHPLDALRDWNRLYGPAGFVQYQFVVPFGAEPALRAIIERLSGAGVASFLAVLKRFGAADPAPLSFPQPGWTLAVDIPARANELAPLLDELDRVVVAAGGRIYLAKDSRVDPGLIRAMYPRLAEWQARRDAADPTGRWCSDLARRLGLVSRPAAAGGTPR